MSDTQLIAIYALDAEGRGIGKDQNNRVIFVENALPESKVLCTIHSEKKHYALGTVLEVVEASPYYEKPKCTSFQECGGCSLQNAQYPYQLTLKKQIIKDALRSIAKIDLPDFPLHESPKIWQYRNKMEFAFGYNDNSQIIAGLRSKNSHTVIAVNCLLCEPEVNILLKHIIELAHSLKIPPYILSEKTQSGFLRFVIIRTVKESATSTPQMLLEFITSSDKTHFKALYTLFHAIKEANPFVSGILHSLRFQKSHIALGEKNLSVKGNKFLTAHLTINGIPLDLTYSAASFFQTNTTCTEKLYSKIASIIEEKKCNRIADIYCGIGGIGIGVAKYLQSKGQNITLNGLEMAYSAIEEAKKNGKANNIEATFTHAHAHNLSRFLKNISLDLVILDPPRQGLDKETIETLLLAKPTYILMVSCNPGTLARDIALLSSTYSIEHLEAFDMFPHTAHVESMVLLRLCF